MLAIRELRKTYGSVTALDGVDLQVNSGEVVGLLGPNGAGKTTLVSIVAGLRRADSGSVRVGAFDALRHPQQARQLIGFAPQDMGIYPIVTVRQNLALFAELTGLSGSQLSSEIEAVADALRIDDLLDRKAGELSGGQKRRLHTAIGLLNDPPLILLDESTTGADVGTRAALLELVRALADRGSAVLYSTHYLQEVEALDASVAILEEGAVIARGPVSELVSSHGDAVVELSFDGPAPDLRLETRVERDSNVLRVATHDPTGTLARIMAELSNGGPSPRGVEIIEPSLETVYLSLTGHRYRDDDAEQSEETDVATS